MNPQRNPVEIIKAHYTARAKARKPKQHGVIGASSVGYPLRRLVMDFRADLYPPAPLADRAIRVFERGDQAHWALRRPLKAVWPDVPLGRFDEVAGEIGDSPEAGWRMPLIDGWEIVGHPDAMLTDVEIDGRTYRLAVLEIKTMAGFGFLRFQTGLERGRELSMPERIGWSYYGQIQAHIWATSAEVGIYLAEAKDTNRLCQQIVQPDPAFVAPMLAKAQFAARAVEAGTDPLALPVCEGQDYGIEAAGQKAGALKWGCSYCPHWRNCWPNFVQYVGARGSLTTAPVNAVPERAVVLAVGPEVTPRTTWDLKGEDEGEDAP